MYLNTKRLQHKVLIINLRIKGEEIGKYVESALLTCNLKLNDIKTQDEYGKPQSSFLSSSAGENVSQSVRNVYSRRHRYYLFT